MPARTIHDILFIFSLLRFLYFQLNFICGMNLENMSKWKRSWKSESYDFHDWRIMFIRFSCRTTWHPIVVRIGRYSCTTWEYIVVRHGVYSRTTWDRNNALLLFFDAKSYKMRIIFMLKSISWVLHWVKTSR